MKLRLSCNEHEHQFKSAVVQGQTEGPRDEAPVRTPVPHGPVDRRLVRTPLLCACMRRLVLLRSNELRLLCMSALHIAEEYTWVMGR